MLVKMNKPLSDLLLRLSNSLSCLTKHRRVPLLTNSKPLNRTVLLKKEHQQNKAKMELKPNKLVSKSVAAIVEEDEDNTEVVEAEEGSMMETMPMPTEEKATSSIEEKATSSTEEKAISLTEVVVNKPEVETTEEVVTEVVVAIAVAEEVTVEVSNSTNLNNSNSNNSKSTEVLCES